MPRSATLFLAALGLLGFAPPGRATESHFYVRNLYDEPMVLFATWSKPVKAKLVARPVAVTDRRPLDKAPTTLSMTGALLGFILLEPHEGARIECVWGDGARLPVEVTFQIRTQASVEGHLPADPATLLLYHVDVWFGDPQSPVGRALVALGQDTHPARQPFAAERTDDGEIVISVPAAGCNCPIL